MMDLTDVPLMSMLRTRMSWLNSRQTLLSQNVANSDTPGYAARDLKPVDFASELACAGPKEFSGMAVTNPRDIALPSGAGAEGDEQQTEAETSPGGNSVSLEEEMIKVADTQAQYQAASNIYSKTIGMMRTAIGSP